MSRVETVLIALEQLMRDGTVSAAGKLPPERDLCIRLGVSRNTLRAALNLLEAQGKIWRLTGSGTYIGKARPSRSEGLLAVSDTSNPTELMELRLILEPAIARLAAMRATPEEIDYLRHCVKKAMSAPDSESYELWDAALHNSIAVATHNSLLVSTCKSINELRRMASWGQLRDRIVADGAQRHWGRQHQAFVEAIARRDGERAEQLARKHVNDVFLQMSNS
jgi:DNA-binding FadR family transcriptional regulator